MKKTILGVIIGVLLMLAVGANIAKPQWEYMYMCIWTVRK
jgi:hypothetical protein